MKVQKTILVNLCRKRPVPDIHLVQYDTGRQIVLNVTDFQIPSGTNATLYVQKPSGKFAYQEKGITVTENKVTIDLENQAITEHGNIPYQLRLKNGTDLITTFIGIMKVQKSLADSGAVESKTVMAAFDEATAEQIAEFQAEAERIAAEVIASIPPDYTTTVGTVIDIGREVQGIRTGFDGTVYETASEAVREQTKQAIEAASGSNAELVDVRTGFDGTVYPTAGEAVRAQAETAIRYTKQSLSREQQAQAKKNIGADFPEVVTAGANLFDKAKAKLNTSFDGGNEITNNQRAVSDYIPVAPGESIAMTKCVPVTEVRCFTDIGAYKSRGTLTAIDDNSTLLVVPDGVQYIRIEITHIPGNATHEYVDRMMVNRGTTLLPYEPYGKKTLNPEVAVPLENILGLGAVASSNDYNDLDNTPVVDTNVTADGGNAVTGQAVFDFVANHSPKGKMTRNIFNKNDIVPAGNNYFRSGLLEVEEDTDYIIFNQVFPGANLAQMAVSYAYDEDGKQISKLGDGQVNTFHTPIGAKTVQLYMYTVASYENPWDYIMIEKGTEPSWIYEPFGNVDNFKDFFNSPFYGKKYVALGDSNTDNKEYPALLAVKLGMYYNPAKTSNGGCECGRGGATIWLNEVIDAQDYSSTSGICSQARIDSLPEDAEIITLAGASNDAGQEKPMGVPSDMQMYTITGHDGSVVGTIREAVVDVPAEPNFYNCYAVSINRIMQKCPNADIYICEIPFRSMQPYEVSGNIKADFFAPYREAQKEVAKHYGLPLLKTYRDAGVNELNFKKFITSTEYDFGIHWNFNGQKRLAEVMASGMLSARY